MASIKCDFFQVVLPDHCQQTFSQMLELISGSSDDASRTIEYWDGSLLRFQNVQHFEDIFVAEMMRIKMKHLPVKAHINGSSEPFDLTPEQGSGESTYFAYNEPTKTIVIHKSANGVPPGAIRLYFEGKCRVKEIQFNDWLDQEIMAKLQSSRNFRAFDIAIDSQVSIAAVSNDSLLRGQIGSVIRALLLPATQHRTIAPRIEIRLSMGSNKQGNIGSNNEIIEEAHACLGLNSDLPGIIQKLIITGKVDGIDEPKPLDLLNGKMTERIAMPQLDDRNYSSLDYRNAIIQAWGNRREEIEYLCGIEH